MMERIQEKCSLLMKQTFHCDYVADGRKESPLSKIIRRSPEAFVSEVLIYLQIYRELFASQGI